MTLSDLDATAQAELVRSGMASPRELVEAAIHRIERENGTLGAIVTPMFESALADAEHAPHGPFRGVPIVIKDLGPEVAGVPQSSGVKALKAARWAPKADSEVVKRLRRAGFILVGKSNASELGILPEAEPDAWPPTRNPFDHTRSSGGSSGGSAAAVAAGLVPIAHGNDGGGSIRIPASCCGLYGLKPSRGRISLAPSLGDINGGLVTEGVLARSVRDSAALLDLLAGMMPGDPYTAPAQLGTYTAELAVPPAQLKIGFATRYPHVDGYLAQSHPDCVAAVERAAKRLEELGHVVEPAEITELHDLEWIGRFMTLYAVGITMELDEIAQRLARPLVPDDVETLTWAIGELGRQVPAFAYTEAWRWIQRSTRRVAAYWERYDLWLTPTVTEPPVPLGYFKSPPDDPLAGIFRAGAFAPFTAVFNATGQPACSVPLHKNAAGLPIGVQLVAAYGREDLLLRVSAQLLDP